MDELSVQEELTFKIENELLILAALEGDILKIKELLKQGADINYKDIFGRTPLICATKNCHLKVIQFLLQRGANVAVTDNDHTSTSPFFHAIDRGQVPIIELLIKYKADVNEIHPLRQETPIIRATKNCNAKVIKTLLEKGADIQVLNHAENLIILLCQEGCSIWLVRSDNGSLQPATSILKNLREIIPTYLKLGIDLNYLPHGSIEYGSQDVFDPYITLPNPDFIGYNALMIVCYWGIQEMVEYFISLGAKVNLKAQNGVTPLMIAAERNHFGIVQYLIQNGSLVNEYNQQNKTALDYAHQNRNLPMLRLLIAEGAATHLEGTYLSLGDSAYPLFHAVGEFFRFARKGASSASIKDLFERGAHLNQRDRDLNTPLHLACAYGTIDTVRKLVKLIKLEDPTLQKKLLTAANRWGQTPLNRAAENVDSRIAYCLMDVIQPWIDRIVFQIKQIPMMEDLPEDLFQSVYPYFVSEDSVFAGEVVGRGGKSLEGSEKVAEMFVRAVRSMEIALAAKKAREGRGDRLVEGKVVECKQVAGGKVVEDRMAVILDESVEFEIEDEEGKVKEHGFTRKLSRLKK